MGASRRMIGDLSFLKDFRNIKPAPIELPYGVYPMAKA